MKVLLVGGSTSVDHLDLRADYPGWIVCQLNANFLRRPQQPCDILFLRSSSGVRPDQIPAGCKLFCDSYFPARAEIFIDQMFLGTNPYGPEFEWTNILSKRLRTYPLIGIIAVTRLLMERGLAELKIIGCNFYPGLNEIGGHYLPTQRYYLKTLAEIDSRLVLEPSLAEYLEVDKTSPFRVFDTSENTLKFHS